MPDAPQQDQTPGQLLAGQTQTQSQPVGNTPLATRLAQMPQQQQQQAPPQPPPQQVVAAQRHHALGRVTSFLFGQQTDPQTGAPVKQPPGAIFRSLLAGALLGGALGSEGSASGSRTGGLISGIARGGAGVQQQQYQRQQQAQQATLEQQRADDEHQVHQATVAKMTAETAAFHHQQEFQNQAAIDQKNAASGLYINTLTDAGGRAAPIPIDGKVPANGEYSAPALVAAYMKDPSILQGPPNTVRHFVDTHDASDLEYVEGKGWVNQRGDQIDLSKSTTVKVIDVPENLYKTRIQHTGKEINTIAGYQLVPKEREDETFNAPLDAYAGLYASNLRNANTAAQAKQRDANAAKAAAQAAKAAAAKRGTPAQFAQVEAKKATALSKAERAFESDGDPAALATAKAGALKAYEDEVVALGGTVTPAGQRQPGRGAPAPGPKKGDTQVHAGFNYTFNGTQWVKGQAAQ